MDKGDDPGSGLWNKVEDWRGSFLKSLNRHEAGFVAPYVGLALDHMGAPVLERRITDSWAARSLDTQGCCPVEHPSDLTASIPWGPAVGPAPWWYSVKPGRQEPAAALFPSRASGSLRSDGSSCLGCLSMRLDSDLCSLHRLC